MSRRPWDPYAPTGDTDPSLGPAWSKRGVEGAPGQPEPPGDDLDTLTKAQLVERAERAGLSTSGTKPELIERLRGR